MMSGIKPGLEQSKRSHNVTFPIVLNDVFIFYP